MTSIACFSLFYADESSMGCPCCVEKQLAEGQECRFRMNRNQQGFVPMAGGKQWLASAVTVEALGQCGR